jgi:hypothetical protein
VVARASVMTTTPARTAATDIAGQRGISGLRRTIGSMSVRTRPLLAKGNEAEWAQINEEEARQEAEFAASLSLSERLEFGQRLCDQAFGLVNAMRASGHGSGRDPRS